MSCELITSTISVRNSTVMLLIADKDSLVSSRDFWVQGHSALKKIL